MCKDISLIVSRGGLFYVKIWVKAMHVISYNCFLLFLKGFAGGRSYRWALFVPNGKALGRVQQLVDSGQVCICTQ